MHPLGILATLAYGPLQSPSVPFSSQPAQEREGVSGGSSSSIVLHSAVVILCCDMLCLTHRVRLPRFLASFRALLGWHFPKSDANQYHTWFNQLLQPNAAIESKEWQACRHVSVRTATAAAARPGSRGASGMLSGKACRAKNAKAGTNARRAWKGAIAEPHGKVRNLGGGPSK